jgi:hypothetical protein
MRIIYLFLITLYFPLITLVQGVTPGVDPELAHYAAEVQGVWESYRTTSSDISGVLRKLADNPLYLRENAFTQDVKDITWRIRQVTNYLASVDAPDRVKDIHDDLIDASDTFDAAAFMLDRFAESHDLDDMIVGFELLGAGLAVWQQAIDRLTAIVGPLP